LISKRKSIVHENMHIQYEKTEGGLWQVAFDPEPTDVNERECVVFPHFQAAVAGMPQGRNSAGATGYSAMFMESRVEQFEESAERIFIKYKHDKTGLAVQVEIELIAGASMLRQTTTAVNEGDSPLVLTQLSSMHMQGIALGGYRSWDDPDKIKVHYCRQAWEGEGQWRSANLEELGLYPTSTHPNSSVVQFSSIGSYSTVTYLPMVVIEDLETSKVWYVQVEASSNWNIEIGHRSSWERPNGSLYLYADGANEKNGGWTKTLSPGESYETVPVAVGCCTGGIQDAIKEMTKYRRIACRPKSVHEQLPIIFNDYMNCLWGDPTTEKLLPLIDAAAEAGAECFCIDAGWFSRIDENWSFGLGDWLDSADRFGTEGLQGIIQYIKSKGLIAGLWLEMEVCGESSALGRRPDAWFLQRNGTRAGGGARWFLDFSHSEVREYMDGVIDRLVELGVGYFKNDYNDTSGYGNTGEDGQSSAEGTLRHSRSFYRFIDEAKERHPALIIENCASGAMRQDYGILKHFDLQSFSDQEVYYKCPSIIGGSLASVLPEQLGIWAYPFPLLHRNMQTPEFVYSNTYQQQMANGEQTIFSMINGLCGHMYVSGRIDAADSLNKALIAEAIQLAKRERRFKAKAYPSWPIGFTKINDNHSWGCVALTSDNGERSVLAVWRIGSEHDNCEIPLVDWAGKNATIKQLYPAKDFDVQHHYQVQKGSLTVCFPEAYQARLFEITLV